MRTILLLLSLALAVSAADPPITALAISPDGKSVVAGSQAGVEVFAWRAEARKGPDDGGGKSTSGPLRASARLKTELAHVHDLAFSPDGKLLAIVGGKPAESGAIEIFSWPEPKLVHRIVAHSDVIYAVAWSSDSKRLATAGGDNVVSLIETVPGKLIKKLEGRSRPVLAVAFLPGDRQLVSGGVDGSLRVWSVESGKIDRELSYHTKAINGLAVRPTKSEEPPTLASIGDDKTVRIWRPSIGRMVCFSRLTSEPKSLVWNAAGDELIVACKDGSIHIIDPETVETRSKLRTAEDQAFSLAISGDGRILTGGRTGILMPKRK